MNSEEIELQKLQQTASQKILREEKKIIKKQLQIYFDEFIIATFDIDEYDKKYYREIQKYIYKCVEYLKLVFENRTFLEININLTKTEHEKLMDFIKKVVPIDKFYKKIYKKYNSKEIEKNKLYTLRNFYEYENFIYNEIRILRLYRGEQSNFQRINDSMR